MNHTKNLPEDSGENQKIKSNKKFKKNLILGILFLLMALISWASFWESKDLPLLITTIISVIIGGYLSLNSWYFFHKQHVQKYHKKEG